MFDTALMKGWAIASGLLAMAGFSGHMLAEAITKDTSVSLEAACIAGTTAVIIAGMFINLKRDNKEMRRDISHIMHHINSCKFSAKPVELEEDKK